jgi:hypothetical protein
MLPLIKNQRARLHSACQDYEIEPFDEVTRTEQAFMLLSKRDAGKVVSHCFARFGWFPTLVLSDNSLPTPGKGRQWIATDLAPTVGHMRALNMIYGLEPIEDERTAEAVVYWAENNPEQLTSGQALRGLDMVRKHLEGGFYA